MDRNIENYLSESEIVLWESVKCINIIGRIVSGCLVISVLIVFLGFLLTESFLQVIFPFKFLFVGILGFSIVLYTGAGVMGPIILALNARQIGYDINDLKHYLSKWVLTNKRLIFKAMHYSSPFGLPKQLPKAVNRLEDMIFMNIAEISEIFLFQNKKKVKIQFCFEYPNFKDLPLSIDLNLKKRNFDEFWSVFKSLVQPEEKKRVEKGHKVFIPML
ncbi:MAG: hypothetical protein JW891_14370 [Candidatus Lokiarchaeota archaeon]|nr:hypothetical protein [Candidatus Lokiarchaeota archaeon]